MLPHPKLQLVHLIWRRGNLQPVRDLRLHKWRYLPHMRIGWGGVSHLRPGGHMPGSWNPLRSSGLWNGVWGITWPWWYSFLSVPLCSSQFQNICAERPDICNFYSYDSGDGYCWLFINCEFQSTSVCPGCTSAQVGCASQGPFTTEDPNPFTTDQLPDEGKQSLRKPFQSTGIIFLCCRSILHGHWRVQS